MSFESMETRRLRQAVENQTKVLADINDALNDLVKEMRKPSESPLLPLCRTCARAQCGMGNTSINASGCKCCEVEHHGDAI
ncbi:hypothetical protein SEA_KARDASHIAN_67 [Streptomyces phage Kardashian]|nr:hypothetical protein SEA_KARDASHIAN_67 [Streptomyces phage Kardashian]